MVRPLQRLFLPPLRRRLGRVRAARLRRLARRAAFRVPLVVVPVLVLLAALVQVPFVSGGGGLSQLFTFESSGVLRPPGWPRQVFPPGSAVVFATTGSDPVVLSRGWVDSDGHFSLFSPLVLVRAVLRLERPGCRSAALARGVVPFCCRRVLRRAPVCIAPAVDVVLQSVVSS